MPFWKNKILIAVIVSIISAVVIGGFAYSNAFKSWQINFADGLYKGENPSNQIVIVDVDQKTLDGLGEYTTWNRDDFAQVLNNINKYNPKAVAFDFFFRAAKDAKSDDDFKNALSQTKNPIIMFPGNPQTYDEKKGYYVNPQDQKATILPLSLFSDLQNISLCLGNVLKDADAVNRRMMPIIDDLGLNRYDENLAFAVARKVLGGEQLPKEPAANANEYDINLQDNGKVKIPLEDGQMLINFFSTPGQKTFSHVSFVDVYNENYDANQINPEALFKDKIVLIGPQANYFNDLYVTPVSVTDKMTGIELQANALQTILDQKFLRNLTFPEQAILILILALTAAFTFMFTKIRWSLLYLFGVPAAYSLSAKPLFDHGIILDLVHPYLTIAAVFIATYLYRYVTEFREKLQLQTSFGKYVNPALVKEIIEHPESLKLGGESRNLTIMFTDIAHSTTIEEKLSAENVVTILSEYFEAMSQVIMEEGGTVDKFEGDGIMALFGAPVAQTDHAVRATRAALNMRIKLAKLLEKWKTDPPLPGGQLKPQIDFRCGLSSGEAIVGNMGSSQRFDYTALGDVVNLASRLEGANKMFGTNIMIGEKTWEKIKDQFEGRELGLVQVIGKNEIIKVFEPWAPKGELPQDAFKLLQQYNEALKLYYSRKFSEALEKFEDLLKASPNDEPSKKYRQRCEVLRDFPPAANWNGAFEMGTK